MYSVFTIIKKKKPKHEAPFSLSYWSPPRDIRIWAERAETRRGAARSGREAAGAGASWQRRASAAARNRCTGTSCSTLSQFAPLSPLFSEFPR